MIKAYKIVGMTCAGCSTKVQSILSKVPGVTSVNVGLENGEAEICMSEQLSINDLKAALNGSKYSISEESPKVSGVVQEMNDQIQKRSSPVQERNSPVQEIGNLVQAHPEENSARLQTYLPVFLIFGYITAITLLIQFEREKFDAREWMSHFMAGFFLVFSFFKILDVPAFAMSYSSYDIIAKRWLGYGYIYPFVELGLGISFLFPSLYGWSNALTLIVMSLSIIGVLQSVLKKEKIKCACLGAVFNLPMSTITIIEDALMIVMSGVSLVLMC